MSPTPEEGEDGAPEDTIDLPGEIHDVEEHGDASDIAEEADHLTEGAALEAETAPATENLDDRWTGSLEASDYFANQNVRNDPGEIRSDEDTVSIPDDTPSVQVCLRRLRATTILTCTGVCFVISAKRSALFPNARFSPKLCQLESSIRPQIPISSLRVSSGYPSSCPFSCLPQFAFTSVIVGQPRLSRCPRTRSDFCAMGCDTLDEVEKDYRTNIFGRWETELRASNMRCNHYKHCHWDVERHSPGLRLSAESQRNNRNGDKSY